VGKKQKIEVRLLQFTNETLFVCDANVQNMKVIKAIQRSVYYIKIMKLSKY